ncbi:MAG TPA: PA14 domain-containing protein, partial [bacterium]|nr:PA14 domain-containing protein [bacterium]
MRMAWAGLLVLLLAAAAQADVVVLWDETCYKCTVTGVDATTVTFTQKGREYRVTRDRVASITFSSAGMATSTTTAEPTDAVAEDTDIETKFGHTRRQRGWLEGKFYFINRSQDVLPDFATLEPEATRLYTPVLNVPEQNVYSHGPIGYRSTDYAISYEGDFSVQAAGEYTVELISDDGSNLYIDGEQLINNDGSHGVQAKQATISLGRGRHHLRVDYFQDTNKVALALRVAP